MTKDERKEACLLSFLCYPSNETVKFQDWRKEWTCTKRHSLCNQNNQTLHHAMPYQHPTKCFLQTCFICSVECFKSPMNTPNQLLKNKASTITQKLHGHYMVIMVRGCIQSVTTSLLSVGEDKGDLLHKGPQPGTETITSTQLDHRLYCLTHRAVEQDNATHPYLYAQPAGRTQYYPQTGIWDKIWGVFFFVYLCFM